MAKQVICHLGVPRAASTYLQAEIFPNLQGVYATGHGRIPGSDDPFRRLGHKIMVANPLRMNIELEKTKLDEFIASIETERIIYSNEAIFGTYNDTFRDHLLNTQILHKLLPQSKVFLLFRRQDTWLESAYRRMIFHGHSIPIEKFLNYRDSEFCRVIASYYGYNIDVHGLDWLPFLKNYASHFGRENVLALPYEMFVSDMEETLRLFYEFADVQSYFPERSTRVNRSDSYLSCRLSQTLDHFLPSSGASRTRRRINRIIDRFSKTSWRFVDRAKRKTIMDMYSHCNQDLAQFLDIDLSRYGYHA